MNCILKIIQLDDILLAGQEHFLKIRRKQEVDEKMKSKFTKLLATALVLCLVLALLPAAAFADDTYAVTVVNSSGQTPYNGTVTLSGSKSGSAARFEAGETVTVTPNPNEGYRLFSISASSNVTDFSDGSPYTFTMPAEAVTITAQFMPYYRIEDAIDMTGGNVIYPETAMYTETVTIAATPDEGYKFVEFKVYGKDTNDIIQTTPAGENKATFQMPNHAVIVSATFVAKETFEITTATSELGYVTAPASAYEGQVVSVSATATASGASVESIKITKTSDGEEYKTITGASGTFDMPAFPVTVKAVFGTITPPVTDTYSIVLASKITGGTLDSDKAMASADETVTITATPYNGYKTVSVYYMANNYPYGITEVATPIGNNKWTFEMPDYDVVVSARFEYDPYYPGTDYHYITVSNPGSHCTVDVKNWAYCGEDVTITLSNFDTGYAFSYLKVNASSLSPTATTATCPPPSRCPTKTWPSRSAPRASAGSTT